MYVLSNGGQNERDIIIRTGIGIGIENLELELNWDWN
jgi:hypothetical protein